MGTPSFKPSLLAGALAAMLVAGAVLTEPAAAANRIVIVQPGDTLSGIAARFGVSVDVLVARNGIADPDHILVGQHLRVPAGSSPVRGARGNYRVQAGDTLGEIAARYGLSVSALAAANRLTNPSLILVGQRLVVPGARDTRGPRDPRPARPRTHLVRPGETLTRIAARYGTSVAALARLNHLADPPYILSGAVLTLPGRGGRLPTVGSEMPDSMASLVAARDGVRRVIVAEARRQGVPVPLALALAWQESGWQQGVVSSAGAIGVMQLLPSTAEWVGSVMLGTAVDPHALRSNVRAGLVLVRHYLDRYGGSRPLALAAYYQGQRAVDVHGIYMISRPYIASILRLEEIFSR